MGGVLSIGKRLPRDTLRAARTLVARTTGERASSAVIFTLPFGVRQKETDGQQRERGTKNKRREGERQSEEKKREEQKTSSQVRLSAPPELARGSDPKTRGVSTATARRGTLRHNAAHLGH